MIEKELREGVLTLTFMHPKPQNPFGDRMQDLLMDALAEAEEDEQVRSILLTGGVDRSFCVGGDFSELVDMKTDFVRVSALLTKIVRLYISVLEVTKPVLAAVDHYAIGLGFQMVMLTDYRIGSDRVKFKMPEVKNGVACTLGGAMLDFFLNRVEMMRICYECDILPVEYVHRVGLVNEVVPADRLMDRAFEKALQYGNYNPTSYRNTKKINNTRFIKVLEDACEPTVLAHYLTFSGNVHKPYMRQILKREAT